MSASTSRITALAGAAVLLALVGSSCSSGSADDASEGEAVATSTLPVPNRERDQRVPTLGQSAPVVSAQSPRERLANGLDPVAGAPLFVGDYADPFVLAVGPRLYLYTTNTVDENVPVLSSRAGVVASPLGDALPELPAWTEPGLVWAPSVLATEDGYVLYYTTVDTGSGLQCIGVASSVSPEGPFLDDHDGPFVCQLELGGTIDASPFTADDGSTWLLYKNDGNCCDIVTEIWAQELSDDGLELIGEPVSLIATSESWEGAAIEGPSMTQVGDKYWLLYSANDWDTADYTVGAARCESPTGPCTKIGQPWLANHGDAVGPGGAEDFTDVLGHRWVVYHAWVTDAVGSENGGTRSLFAVPLEVDGEVPAPGGLQDR